MSFESNRTDFEKALFECEEIFDAMEVLIKPEILNTFISMVEEYKIHYARDIDELISENSHLIVQVDELEDRVCELLKEVDSKDHEILDCHGEIKQLEREINKNEI